MKTIKILSAIILLGISLQSSFAQVSDSDRKASKKLNRKVQTKNYTDNTYSPTETVKIYRTNKPERPYIEIAQIETDASRKNAMELLIAKAKELGGDAIIITGEENKGAIAIPIGTMVYAAPVNYLVAIVIKFKK